MASKKIEFVTYDADARKPFDSASIPQTLSLSKLHRGDAKIYSRKGGSDGELALARFLNGLSTWTQDNFCEQVPAQNGKQAYIHIKASVDDAFLEFV